MKKDNEMNFSYITAILHGEKDESYYEKSIVNMFEDQVEATPEKIAIEDKSRKVTYQELNSMANRLREHIKEGISYQNKIVAIFMKNSIELVVSVLAILKAGGIYVPLDINTTQYRINEIIDDCQPSLILISAELSDIEGADLSNNSEEQIEKQDSIKMKTARISKRSNVINVKQIMNSNDGNQKYCNEKIPFAEYVYMIYTSGSTGKPKGVIVKQKGLQNYLGWAKKKYVYSDEVLTFALYSPLAFDLTVTSVYVPLISGNKIKIYNSINSAYSVYKIIRDNEVNILKLTPTHLSVIKNEDLSNSKIHILIVGGEAFKTSLAKKVYDMFSGRVVIYNEYGPTEATVGCMIHQYNPEKDIEGMVPIGVPIDNTNIYILDKKMRPVNINQVGEIYISGDCVAKGYFKRDELTKKAFISDTFNDNITMYKSHDLARILSNNSIMFLGRSEQQIKLRGYRIELEEIEYHIYCISGVREVAVIFNEDGINSMIYAFVVFENGCTAEYVKSCLKEKLPDYMIPDNFVEVSSLPHSNSGKVDRNKLKSEFSKTVSGSIV